MTTILINRPLMPLIVDQLAERFTLVRWYEQDEATRRAFLAEGARAVRGIVCGYSAERIDGAFMDQFPALEVIANFGVGYDNIDASAAAARGIVVTNTPDVLTEEVADLTIGLLVATVRRIPQADAHLRSGAWMRAPFPLTGSLRGRRIGLLGLGRIGLAIARRLEAFGLPIAYCARRPREDVAYRHLPSAEALAEAVDVLIVIAPATPETLRIVDARVLRALGPEGVLINVARGSLVDEAALVEALETGVIAAAGLDVFEVEPCHPARLAALPQVVLLPHVGSASEHTRALMGQLTVDNAVSWFTAGRPLTPVAETPFPV